MFCVGTCCRLEMKVLTARRAQMKWMVPIFIKQQASILFQWKQSSYQLILYSQQFNPFFFNLFFWVETLRPVTHSKSNTNWSNCQKYFMSWFPPTSYLFPWLKVFLCRHWIGKFLFNLLTIYSLHNMTNTNTVSQSQLERIKNKIITETSF